ncbi:hypothetical protein RHOER0001_0879 [Rhodococcus erythropolis SK121]|nr:hypothetical protein RHOER0001_0879 [Rhodococcus erythropolis SK121]
MPAFCNETNGLEKTGLCSNFAFLRTMRYSIGVPSQGSRMAEFRTWRRKAPIIQKY